ncbi:phosphatase PAP2 family protein [Imhoffiella purpurea]|uniref:undecaprenyl-diphosphate phosphatase n=1 Tax=Imhoffiella purpurea TaxID=1249627 RepID=W9V3H9_9GAMM|nr:phosphatase PAP2 family protein [Imhoffiella purpurea]EXJ14073.1 Lipoprotein signal peptidase [Imhoffiella purpurea]
MMGASLGRFHAEWRRRLQAGVERAPELDPRSGVWLIRWALVALLVGSTIYLICGYHGGFERLNGIASGYPDWLWEHLTSLGDERLVFALSLLFSLRYPRLFWSLVVAGTIAALYGRGFKALFDASRPPAVLAADLFNLIGPAHRHASFPSGHSVTAAVFCGVLLFHSHRWGWRVLLTLIAVAVGLSRIAVGVHWPVDVAAGLMGGALAAWVGCRIAQRWSGPAANPVLHLSIVILAAFPAMSLLYDPGDYSSAVPMVRILGLAGLVGMLVQYGLLPWRSLARVDGLR